jgi:hypothetical protein
MACRSGWYNRRETYFATALLGLLVTLGAVAQPAAASDRLPALGAAIGATSASGLSSGAYMAGQIQLAHAKDVVGAGLVAGGPFACAESAAGRLMPYWPTAVVQNAQKALYGCMLVDWGTPDPVALADRAKELASAGAIGSLADLAADKIYLYSGNADRTVTRPVVEAAKGLYRELGVPEQNIALVEGEGGHGFLTEDEGEACALTDKPYVNDCDYDQAKAILEWIYGPLAAPAAAASGRFVNFRPIRLRRSRRRARRRGRPLRAPGLRGRSRLPRACHASWLRAGTGDRWRRPDQAIRLRRTRRHQPADRAVSPDRGVGIV